MFTSCQELLKGSKMATDSSLAWIGESSKLYIVIILIALGAVTWITGAPSSDPREPPVLKPKIPIIGHLLGLAIDQAEYLQKLSARTTHPIFTLRIFSGRIYVIKSPPLVQAVYKNPKAFSFDPIFIDASQRIFGMSKDHMKIITKKDPSDTSDGFPLSKATQSIMHSSMAAGPALLEMNARALTSFSRFLECLEGPTTVNLYSWLFRTFTVATAEAIYGPNNPIALNRKLINPLLDFEAAIGLLYLNLFPSVTASKGYQARKLFAAEFKKYYDAGHDKDAAAIVKGRKRVLGGGGYTTDDLGSFDIGILVAATMNSNPALFWLLIHIYSSPSLLSSIRAEVENITSLKTSSSGQKTADINISALNTSCPLLVSTWQETLRLTDATVSSRVVATDTLLDDTYLLKKGGVIQMACGPMHTSPQIWGLDSDTFNAQRFTKFNEDHLDRGTKKLRKQGFVPFGGGTVLCPGRYFASTEIMGVAANIVLGYDILREDGKPLEVPGTKKQAMSVQVKHPEKDVEVVIRRRKEWEGVKWAFDVGAGAEEQELFLG
ncbi:related to cytochrome P450 7B1 (oxysterol 7-alpha-hydroxylase) [Phialocephala subalpina]|uniref:Related to cytochrome P450 7B1 (Oxysterol 7-alpha-hydroxylase) n=1 Tax=Phialocephala subalpina TaxID=576137 RepID=A0A1L7WIW6_9HELO|nr:related to cytochrome P450 7B1 (oxysterol 7-alpha-hydroxylase) [Phialocephala subalpina]